VESKIDPIVLKTMTEDSQLLYLLSAVYNLRINLKQTLSYNSGSVKSVVCDTQIMTSKLFIYVYPTCALWEIFLKSII